MTREEGCRLIAQTMMRFYGRADDLLATKLEAEALYDALVVPAVAAERERCAAAVQLVSDYIEEPFTVEQMDDLAVAIRIPA